VTKWKKGVSDLLEIRVYPFTQAFNIDMFSSHVLHRTSRLFIQRGTIGERCFIAVTALDPETKAPGTALAILVPMWQLGTRDAIYAEVREFLAYSQGIAVSSATETEHGLTVSVEWNGQRTAFAAMKIRGVAGRFVLAQWERVGAGVALPLLPTVPGNLQ
jgi:hypothetical protein